MATYQIELPDALVVTSRGVECVVAVKDISVELLARCALHGLTQKVADAASGAAKDAKDEEEVKVNTEAAMNKAVDALVKGEWGKVRGASGVDEFTTVARQVARAAIKAKFGSKSAQWATFTGLDDAAQSAKCDEVFAANESALRPAVEQKIAQRVSERKAKAKLGASIEVTI
jgi:hypothetical protein